MYQSSTVGEINILPRYTRGISLVEAPMGLEFDTIWEDENVAVLCLQSLSKTIQRSPNFSNLKAKNWFKKLNSLRN